MIGRIETLAVDAVVNAANPALQPGTGVDGALRAAAGPALTDYTSRLRPIGVGEAVITPGFNLPAKYIIHTAAPVFSREGSETEKIEGLSLCYVSCITLASRNNLRSIAFPCLGTGNFGWPRELACETALDACQAALNAAPAFARVVFCCFTAADAAPYRARLG